MANDNLNDNPDNQGGDNQGDNPDNTNLLEGGEGEGQGEGGGDKPDNSTSPKNLLGDDEGEGEGQGEGGGDNADTPPTEEELKAFADGISAFDLGDGVKVNMEEFKAYQGELMKLTGGDPKKAEGLVKAHMTYLQSKQKAQEEAMMAFNQGLIAECEKRWPGAELTKVVKLAKVGGKEVFGEKLWNEIRRVPQFANNPDILERFAAIGRKYAGDTGKVISKSAEGGEDDGDIYKKMYGNVKI